MGVDVRRAHNDLAGFSVAIISVVYAVLLVFIAVATWDSFAEAQNCFARIFRVNSIDTLYGEKSKSSGVIVLLQ